MRSIDTKVVSQTNEMVVLELIIDNKMVGKIYVVKKDGVGVVKINFSKKLFAGTFGAILLNEILITALFSLDNLIKSEIYIDKDSSMINLYKESFKVRWEDKDAASTKGCYYLEK